MFIVVNIILVAAAFMLILVVAATSSIPSGQESGSDSPDGEWTGPSGPLEDRNPQQPASGRDASRHRIAAAGMQ